MGSNTANQLIIFTKAPRIGMVKTRLAQAIGPEEAASAYKELLTEIGKRLASISSATVWYSPADAEMELRPFFPAHWRFRAQAGKNLGDRMRNAFADAFAEGAAKVVIIGSDCPYLLTKDIREAWNELDQKEVVFGPAEDGGYWLVGAKVVHPRLFEEIDWGTETVLQESLRRARELSLRIGLLRILSDIDTAEDWSAYQRSKGSGLQR